MLEALPEVPGVLYRAPTALPQPAPELARHYARLTLRDVDLGYAGRRAPIMSASSHRSAEPRDVLVLQQEREHWALVDGKGNTVGWLARAYAPPAACVA